MHELNATQEIIRILKETINEKNIRELNVVELAIGVLTTYEKAPFIQYYDLLKIEESALSKSRLDVLMIPGKISCLKCGKESLIRSELQLYCIHCGSGRTRIIEGNDVIIKNLKVNKK